MTKKILLSLVTMSILLITFQNFSTSPQEIIVYISNNGNDLNSGQKQTPIKSLSRALQLVKERRLIQDSPARILFENGTYFGEKIIWNSYSAIYQTRFEPASNQFGGVIFDGRLNPNEKLGSTSYFINFNLPRTAITGQKKLQRALLQHVGYDSEYLHRKTWI